MNNKAMEKMLDGLVQRYAFLSRNGVNGYSRQNVGHHIVSRRVMLLRHDIANIFPCDNMQHTLIHAGKIDPYDYLSAERKEYLQEMEHKDFKQYLLEKGITKEDFFNIQLNKLNQAIYELENR